MIMRRLQKNFDIYGRGYTPPRLALVETFPEEGFAGSLDTWNNGSIFEEDVNEWEEIL